MNNLLSETALIVIIIFLTIKLIHFWIILGRKIKALKTEINDLIKESESDEYLINFLSKEKQHLSDLSVENQLLINNLKDVVSTQDAVIKELNFIKKVHDPVFDLPIGFELQGIENNNPIK